MKKDRNCMNAAYPVYPMYQQGMMQPGMMQPGYMQPMMQPSMPITSTNNMSSDLSSINSQIASLEKRVARLEGIVGNNNTYSESNFYMV